MKTFAHIPMRRPVRGYATLAMSVIILVLISLIGLNLANSHISIARTIRNSIEHTIALADAEAKIDKVFDWAKGVSIDVTGWGACDLAASGFQNATNYSGWRCAQASALNATLSTNAYLATPPSGTPTHGLIFHVIALGLSGNDDETKAVVKDGFYFYDGSTGGDLSKTPPIVAAGNVPLNGTFSVVANPNAGGTGVGVSIWSGNAITFGPSNSFATCHIEAYENSTSTVKKCPGTAASGALTTQTTPQTERYDIVDSDANFPGQGVLFTLLTQTEDSDAARTALKERLGSNVVSSCGSALSGKTGIVWVNDITGTCDVPAMGTSTAPVLLISESNSINLTDNFYGVVYQYKSKTGDTIDANGNNFVRGAMISDNGGTMGTIMNGTFAVVSDPAVLKNLSGIISIQSGSRRLVKIPGAWADYL